MTIKYIGVEPKEKDTTKLVFSLTDGYKVIAGLERYDDTQVVLMDSDGDITDCYVEYKDIDNMIEALRQAKELWGGK